MHYYVVLCNSSLFSFFYLLFSFANVEKITFRIMNHEFYIEKSPIYSLVPIFLSCYCFIFISSLVTATFIQLFWFHVLSADYLL